ncbi:uncharacterized protein [Diadema antillarum]|uniref:uncharacterized protein isoform X2 n=1 Tax=Diadema antillarum TaxID=105358 RepID=UPI003A848FAD
MRKLKKWFMRHKRNRNPNAPIPDIPKFEEADTDPKAGTSAEGADMEAAASLEPRLSSSATDTNDVAEHDNLFDLSGTAADLDHTNDEFENNERLMQEEEERLHSQEQVEVEDIFQSDQEGADPEAFAPPEANGTHNEMEDIFKDDVKNMSHDFEPIFQTEMPDYDPVEMDSRDTLNSHPEMSVEDLDTEGDVPADAQIGCHANDLPFPDVPSKSDIVLDWEEEDKAVSPTPPLGTETPAVAPPSLLPQQDDEIDEGEVAKFVENILISSAREVYSVDSEQECADKVESEPVEQESAAEAITLETTVESEHVLCQEKGLEEAVVHAVCEPEEKESLSVSVDALLPESVVNSKVSTDTECDEDKMDSVPVVPASREDITAEEAPKTNIVETLDIKDPEKQTFDSPSEAEPIAVSPKTAESHESPSRKMSVPKPRDIRRDLSFFGSGSSSGKSFMSNTLPRVSVLPRISTTYQRKSPISPSSDMDSFDKSTEELPTIPKPDLSASKSPVIAELDAVELPHIETLSTAPVVPPVKSAESVVPVSETKVESSPTVMSPIYASAGDTQEPIYLDGSSPDEIEAIFNKDPEEEKPAKKSMGKSDVLASTRVRKVSRNTWKGQEEFQKSVEKSKIILDEPQAASLRRYEERKKQRQGAFIRSRQDSTSEAESEGSQSSTPRTTPKMPDVVQSGESGARDGEAQSEIVQPKLNMKSVRSLWEQKAAEVEQRRRSLQTKTRPVSHGERARSSSTRAINKSSDNIDSLDDSIEGNTSFSYDGLSDDSSSKRESLIERDIRLQKEREREISKERERLRSESTSSRDESQPSETSENPDDQVVDIVRDTEMRRDSDDGRSSPSQSSGYTSGRSTPSMPADDILKIKSGKGGKMPDLKMSLSPSDPDAQSNYREYQKMLRGNKADGKFSKSATFPRRMESNFETQASSSGSLAISVGDVPDVIMVDGMNSSTTTSEKTRKTSIVQQGIKLSQTLEKKKVAKLESKPRRSLMDMEIQAQREKEEAFRREQQTRKLSGTTSPLPSPSPQDEAKPESTSGSTSSSSATSPATTPQGSPRKTSVSGQPAKSVYKDLNYVPKTNKKKLALAEHWEHKWK